jgi:hypothetical protein
MSVSRQHRICRQWCSPEGEPSQEVYVLHRSEGDLLSSHEEVVLIWASHLEQELEQILLCRYQRALKELYQPTGC